MTKLIKLCSIILNNSILYFIVQYILTMEFFMEIKKAFTLSEVLITLGIIGVVAALTIPVIISKIDERETIVH